MIVGVKHMPDNQHNDSSKKQNPNKKDDSTVKHPNNREQGDRNHFNKKTNPKKK